MKSKYEQVADFIEEKIRSDYHKTGAYLPGERVLAEELGVSRMTLRAGLNLLKQNGIITPENGKGYRIVGERPERVKTYLVGCVFAGRKNEAATFTAVAVNEISRTLEKDGYHMIYSSSDDNVRQEVSKIRQLLDRGVDGLIVMPAYRSGEGAECRDEQGNYDYLKTLYDGGLPVVIVDRSYAAGGIPCVCNDDRRGEYKAAEYFIRKGYRDVVAFLPAGNRVAKLRHKGYMDALLDHGLEPRIFPFNSYADEKSQRREAEKFLAALPGKCAVVTGGYMPGILSGIVNDSHYKGPELEWIGYDISPADIPGVCDPYPYMKRPLAEISRKAGEKIIALLNGVRCGKLEEFIEPEIVLP